MVKEGDTSSAGETANVPKLELDAQANWPPRYRLSLGVEPDGRGEGVEEEVATTTATRKRRKNGIQERKSGDLQLHARS